MIYSVPRKPLDERHIRKESQKEADAFDYGNVIVKKPWGYEYLVFENDFVAIWMLQIIRKRKTSMHCHPKKNTGLILLSDNSTFHHLDGDIEIKKLDAVNIEAGAFHSTEAASSLSINPISENGVWVMEIESPPYKTDLCRLNDSYGRAGTSYEGLNHMVFEPKEILKLEEPQAPERIYKKKFQDFIFTVRKGPFLKDKHYPTTKALTCIIGRDPSVEYDNPNLQIGKMNDFDMFCNNSNGDELDGVMTLTIEQEENLMKLSDYIASYVADLGVKHVFSVCGGGAMHLVDSFGANRKIKYIATHHEQAAAMAAEGYARITGGPGAALVTSGPGGTNTVTGVYGAWVDSIPTIFISGQVTQDTLICKTGLRQFGIQEGNIVDIVRPITKYAVTVTDPATIRYHLEKACYLATNGRPGPVWLDIPLDVQSKLINPEKQLGFTLERKTSSSQNYVLQGLVSKCTDLLAKAKRPVLIYGYGVRLSKAEHLLRKLVDKLRIPTISSWTSSDVFDTKDDNYIGRSGIMGDRAGNFTVQNSDLLLIVGSRMSIPQIGYNYKLFARAAKKIMVDIDEAELKKPSLEIDLPIQADAREFLQEVICQIEAEDGFNLSIEDWRDCCLKWKNKYPVAMPEYKENTYKVNSFYFVDRLSKKLDQDAAIITDMGTSFTCTMQTFQTRLGQRLFTSSGFASMGYGLPGAIGACLARGKKTILITGDGGLQMNIQELQTVIHYKLPLIIFVLNNEGYLTIKLMQQNHFGRYVGSNPASGMSCPDIIKLAEAYGIKSVRINSQKDLDKRLDKVLAEPGPYICEIMMPEEQPLIPRVSSLKLPDGAIISKPMEDLYPFLDEEEFLENMIIEPVEILGK